MRKASWLNSKTILVKDVELSSYSYYIKSKTWFTQLLIDDREKYDLTFYDNNLVDMLIGENNIVFIVREKTKELVEQVNKINSKND